ncbi:MAG: putative lipid II flippase FtsW [Methyloprofundus sp.]|nr:putative lipid II flippase FtsW [Methyloprofundus sp.]
MIALDRLTAQLESLREETFYYDTALVIAGFALLIIGYLMVTSAGLDLGVRKQGNEFHYPLRQLIHIIIGLIAAVIVFMVPMELWEKSAQLLFFIGLLLLVLVLIPGLGIKVNGSMRWLSIAGVRIQVSEAMKFSVVIYIASFVAHHHDFVKQSVYGLVKPLLLLSVACALLLKEPDMGSAVVVFVIALGIMFLSGARMQQFLLLLLAAVVAGVIAISVSGYRMRRVTSFWEPWKDPYGDSFQLVQALMSFGRGEWFGVGLGSGVQKLTYLPEAHTDFLFSVLAEELGFIGVLTVITLFAVIVWRAFVIGILAEELNQKFPAFTAYGLGIWFAFQSFVNMGVNMGLLPTKGLTLPFMSYGGGSMIIMCCAMAVLYRINSEMQVLRIAKEKKYA